MNEKGRAWLVAGAWPGLQAFVWRNQPLHFTVAVHPRNTIDHSQTEVTVCFI
jgi:hypothetical protein